MTIMITGGAGFIGSSLAKELAKEHSIIILDNLHTGSYDNLKDVKQHPIDLAGENQNSHCDGICPNGKTYDVKSSKLREYKYWSFSTRNKYKEDIEIYYFLAFNEDYTKLKYAWRVFGEIVEQKRFAVGLIENMKEYDKTNLKRLI